MSTLTRMAGTKTRGLKRKNCESSSKVHLKFWRISLPFSLKQRNEVAKFEVLWMT